MLPSLLPACSTQTVSPVWKNVPIQWLSTSSLIPSKLCSRPSTYSATPGLLKKPTRALPSPSARSVGSMVTSNRYVKRRLLHAHCAPSNTPRPSITAPTPHAPAGETLKRYLGAASPPQPDGPTVAKRTRPGAGTAPNDPLSCPAVEENQTVLDADQMDVHQDAPQAVPNRPTAPGSNTPPQSLLLPFQDKTPRATRTTTAAPPAMTRSACKGGPPPPEGEASPSPATRHSAGSAW